MALSADYDVAHAASSPTISPYKDATISMDWHTNKMRTAITGKPIPLVGSGSLKETALPQLDSITLAFATGECGQETWGGVPGGSLGKANVGSLSAAGVNYTISTGGQAGVFRCTSNDGMDKFLANYNSPQLAGIDYDMEGGQNAGDIANIIKTAAHAKAKNPKLHISFTLATLGASDGSHGGLNTLGQEVMNQLKKSSLKGYTVNIMAMDYGSASPTVCVVSNGKCDMGQSAIQAVKNLQHSFGTPASQTEVTLMLGQNDVAGEVTTTDNIKTVTSFAKNTGLAGVHWWSLDRDTTCPNPASTQASPTCNGVPGSTSLEFSRAFFGGGSPPPTTTTPAPTSTTPSPTSTAPAPTSPTPPPTPPVPSPAKPWAAGGRYAVGELVSYKGKTYRCLQAHTANNPTWTPSTTPALWEEINL